MTAAKLNRLLAKLEKMNVNLTKDASSKCFAVAEVAQLAVRSNEDCQRIIREKLKVPQA